MTWIYLTIKMNGLNKSSSTMGMGFEELDGSNYRKFILNMTDYLQKEDLQNLIMEREKILKELEEGESNYKKKYEK